MALQQRLSLFGLCICLLLAVGFAAGDPSPPPPAGCYRTARSVPSWCAGKFIQALFDGVKNFPMKDSCCELLTCVGEDTCISVLRELCPPPAKGVDWPCPPHQAGHVY